jgi:hypothetical protein
MTRLRRTGLRSLLAFAALLSADCTEPGALFRGTVVSIGQQPGSTRLRSFRMYVSGGTDNCQDSRQVSFTDDTPVYGWVGPRLLRFTADSIHAGQQVAVRLDENSVATSCPGGYVSYSIVIDPH